MEIEWDVYAREPLRPYEQTLGFYPSAYVISMHIFYEGGSELRCNICCLVAFFAGGKT